jgi:hypothetical protein
MEAEESRLSVQNTTPAFAAARIVDLERERDLLRQLVDSLSVRVAVQAEMLGRSAEHRCDSAGRIKELETALAPFAAVFATGWDDGSLLPTAWYPVRMGDLRQAARVLAGTHRAV